MKKELIGLCTVGALTLPAVAGAPVFEEGFESYSTTQRLPSISTWEAWDGDPGAADFFATTAQAHTGSQSVEINGVDDAVHQFDALNLTSGVWAFETWQFVPTAMNDSQYYILLNTYSSGGAKNWSTQVEMNGSDNVAHDDGTGNELPLVKGAWAEIRVVIDLEGDGQTFFYNGDPLYTGTWSGHISGGGALKIDTIDLWGNGSAHNVYYDDIVIDPLPPIGACCFDDGSCQDNVDPSDCDTMDGTFQGFGTACVAVECPELTPDGWLVDAPFTWTGNTCDEDDTCLGDSPDIQWVVTVPFEGNFTFSVCGAVWDTTLSLGSGPCMSNIAFSDDAPGCGLASEFTVTLAPGTYYLTLEGLSQFDCGPFNLQVTGFCIIDTVGTPEGEPDCGPGYVDNFNGGCNSTPPVYSPVSCGSVIAGKYGNFDAGSRDTDWYRIQLTEATELTWTVTGEGPTVVFIIDITAGCDALEILESDSGGTCETAEVSATVGAGTYVLFVAPSGFDLGIPCGSDYQAELTCGAGADCPEDIDGSGTVGFADLLAVLNAWGPCPGCPEDIDGSGTVGFSDLLAVLNAWGPCP